MLKTLLRQVQFYFKVSLPPENSLGIVFKLLTEEYPITTIDINDDFT